MVFYEKIDGYVVGKDYSGFWGPKVVERIPLEEWYRQHPEDRPGYEPPAEEPVAEGLPTEEANSDAGNRDSVVVVPKKSETLESEVMISAEPSVEKPSVRLVSTSAKLCVVAQESIGQSELQEINQRIDQLIAVYSHNRQEINRLVFDSVAAMTVGVRP